MLPDEPHVRVTLDQIYGICLEVKQTVTEVLTENRARDRQVDRHEQQIATLDARQDQVEQHRATRAEVEQLRGEQQTRTRWAMGIAISAVGVLIAGVGLVFAAMRVWLGIG